MDKARAKRWVFFGLRWGIAIAGIWWVLSNMSFRDQVVILDAQDRPVSAALLREPTPEAPHYSVVDPATGQAVPALLTGQRFPNDRTYKELVYTLPGRPSKLTLADGRTTRLLALDLAEDRRTVRRLLVEEPGTGRGTWVPPAADVKKVHAQQVARPLVEEGIFRLVREARPALLWLAVLIYPLTYIITSIRWHELLKALEIRIGLARTFVLNMVGAFYNSFMPGSTGGDVLKAYYAARHTEHRTRAVLSVVVDRVIGLLALVILGGIMAAYAALTSTDPAHPATTAARRVAVGAAAICAAFAAFVLVFGVTGVRTALGLDFVLRKLPLQKQVQRAMEVMRIYRSRKGLMTGALLATLPVHITVVVSAMFAGMAFGLPIPAGYYFVAVPVIVLAGAVPISPQGAGVMEFFAVQFTEQHGTTVGQAFALAMSIRLVQMLWNLAGGLFVFRGGYHAPTETEQRELESDEEQAASGQLPVAGETPSSLATGN